MQMEPLKGTAVGRGRGSARLCSKTIYYLPNAQGRPKPEVTQINVNPPQVPSSVVRGVTIMHWQKMPTLEKDCDASSNLFLKDTLAACLPLHIFKIDFLLVYVLL